MEDTAHNQAVIIMTGMHRSGTSLTASLLQSAGINIGDRLMAEDQGNAKGHFEDLDFVEFHQNVLQSQGISVAGWTEQKQVQVQPQYLALANNLIATRHQQHLWGWKDPRTTLFLDFWSQLLPQAKYVFVYRSPWDVIDSLFRRGDVIFRTNPNFAVQQWCNYNQTVLDFYQSHQEQSLLLEIDSIIDDSKVVDLVQQKFGLELRSPESLYEPALFTVDPNTYYRQALLNKFFPEAVDLYHQLAEQADVSSLATKVNHQEHQVVNSICESWILQDWVDLRLKQTENKQLQVTSAELAHTQQQLQTTSAELAHTQQQLQTTSVELAHTQQQLQTTSVELAHTQQQLQTISVELVHTQQQLQTTSVELAHTQQQLQTTSVELVHTQQHQQQSQQELAQARQHQQQSQQELAQARQHQQQSQQELAQARQHQEQLQQELAQARQQLQTVTNELTQFQQQQQESAQFQKQLQIAQMQTEQFKLLVSAMETSKFWKLRRWWFNIKQKTNLTRIDTVYQNYLISQNKLPLPEQQIDVDVIVDSEIPQSDNVQYQKWLENNYPRSAELTKLGEGSLKLAYQPLISIIVPVYNPEENFLRQAIESVLAQVYSNWELCLADDCSTKPYVRSLLEEYAQQDSRIKITFRNENGHICHTSNSALSLATGEYIALLDHDDLLPPHALVRVVELLNKHPEADFIYSDEDKVDEDNVHKDPFFKPDWCPDSFLARMYTCHLGVYRRSLVTEVGNFRVGFEGSQDYDLVLRVTEKTDQIYHIPDILYHWRIHQQSTAAAMGAKPYAANAAQKALSEALGRRGEPGKIKTRANLPGVYTVRYEIKEPKLVSIIIPTKDLADTLNVCLKSIFAKTTYSNYEVIVIDNGSTEAKTARCFEFWQQKQPDRFKCYKYDIPFNYSQINNYAVEQAKGEYLLFLNNDTEVITPDWLEGMVEQAQRPSIGAVGSLLLYPDDTIQHAGVVLGIGGVGGHSHKHLHVSQPGYISQAASINNYSAVTAACLMCRREVFEEVGGFEETLAIAFNDVDFCIKIATHGYRNIYLPHVKLYHYESKSRGYENTPAKQARFAQEVNYMRHKWSHICDRDPCYNPNLTKSREDYSLNV
ncbi:MAG: glycosyltransferase [Cyanobacteria bacterium P01_A01_bin.83]